MSNTGSITQYIINCELVKISVDLGITTSYKFAELAVRGLVPIETIPKEDLGLSLDEFSDKHLNPALYLFRCSSRPPENNATDWAGIAAALSAEISSGEIKIRNPVRYELVARVDEQ